MERKVALITNYENFILYQKPPDLLIQRLNEDVLNLTKRLQNNQSFDDIYGFSCFYLLSRYPDYIQRQSKNENFDFLSNVKKCLRSIDNQLTGRKALGTNFTVSHSIKLIDIKVILEKYTLQYKHSPIRIWKLPFLVLPKVFCFNTASAFTFDSYVNHIN